MCGRFSILEAFIRQLATEKSVQTTELHEVRSFERPGEQLVTEYVRYSVTSCIIGRGNYRMTPPSVITPTKSGATYRTTGMFDR